MSAYDRRGGSIGSGPEGRVTTAKSRHALFVKKTRIVIRWTREDKERREIKRGKKVREEKKKRKGVLKISSF